jgi:hypothetical protein
MLILDPGSWVGGRPCREGRYAEFSRLSGPKNFQNFYRSGCQRSAPRIHQQTGIALARKPFTRAAQRKGIIPFAGVTAVGDIARLFVPNEREILSRKA